MAQYLDTDEFEEAVSALEMVAESVARVATDVYRWKWALVALHSAVQGFMVLALRGPNGLNALKDDVATKWLEADEKGLPYPKERLDTYEKLYEKVKSDRMLMYVQSQKFVPQGSEGKSIKKLKALRDEFIHFVPKGWLLEVSGLPGAFEDCLNVIEFLGWKSGNVLWTEGRPGERAMRAIAEARQALAQLRRIYST